MGIAGCGLLEEREVCTDETLAEGRGEGEAFGGDNGVKNLRGRQKRLY